MSIGNLYVVASPIGNLDDLSQRAASILRNSDLIVCEDTRHTRKLLEHCSISRPLDAYHDFSGANKVENLIRKLESGKNLALVSDAGTPTISDPGYRLIRSCRQRAVPVVPIPGPCAAIAALSVSGMPTDQFRFVGFLPSRKEARRRELESLKRVRCTLVFYEAPRRIRKSLKDMRDVLGNREVFVAREMTKIHEECILGPISDVAAQVREQGEAVIVLAGSPTDESVQDSVDIDQITRQKLLKVAASRLGVTRKQLYDVLYRNKQ